MKLSASRVVLFFALLAVPAFGQPKMITTDDLEKTYGKSDENYTAADAAREVDERLESNRAATHSLNCTKWKSEGSKHSLERYKSECLPPEEKKEASQKADAAPASKELTAEQQAVLDSLMKLLQKRPRDTGFEGK